MLVSLGISALLVSPSLAQVFGPGPSPSSLFDTVLNLPGDEAVVTGADFESIGSFEQTTQLNVSDGGAVGFLFFADNSEVNISGGTVGDIFTSLSNSEVNISGGTVGDFFDAGIGSVVNISGGTVGNFFTANSGSEVNISGGTVGNDFFAIFGSEVNIFGSEFFIDGVELETLLLGEAFTITDRDVTLSGLLADGEQFGFELGSADSLDDFFSSEATLTVTLTVPEPSSPALISLAVVMGLARRRR